jgi:hypothetical protein
MDHAEVRELLELASAEPGGLERIVSGDAPQAAALAGHLAGCPQCAAEADALRRSGTVVRDVIRTSPSADLRDRTLAYVAEMGRDRSQPSVQGAAPQPVASPASAKDWSLPALRDWRPLAWAGSLAAVIVVSVVATASIVGGRVDTQLAEASAAIEDQRAAIAGLAMLSDWTIRLSADVEAARARLSPPEGGGTATGTVMFSSATHELVMVASGLSPPPVGDEYRCWVEIDGRQEPIGRMYFAGDLAYWVGEVEALTGSEDIGFGVSLVDAASVNLTDVILRGES